MDRGSPLVQSAGSGTTTPLGAKGSSRNGSSSGMRVSSFPFPKTSDTTSSQDRSSSPNPVRKSSFGLGFLSSITNSMRPHAGNSDEPHMSNDRSSPPITETSHNFMSNSPTIANLASYSGEDSGVTQTDLDRIPEQGLNPAAELERIDASELETGFSCYKKPDEQVTSSSLDASAESSSGPLAPAPVLTSATSPVNQPQSSKQSEVRIPDPTRFQAKISAPSTSASTSGIQTQTNTTQQDSTQQAEVAESVNGMDKDGFYSIRLTPIIDHSSSSSGLYFAPIIRKIKPASEISIGRYTEKNKSAAHAPQGSSAPVVFKSKVVSRTHALFSCNDDGQWFLKDCKSSSGTFLNHVRLSQASQESSLMPLIDGDVIQLGMDYRGGTEEVYRCVKMRCEFNKSWQRKVNQYNLEIHKKLKNLSIGGEVKEQEFNPLKEDLSDCAICLMKLEPCQAMFISPCSHSWHYKCIRPIIIKSYPQFYCPNCRCMCDLETDIDEDEDDLYNT